MLGSLTNRFRVAVLLLAFAVALAGQGVANAAMMASMQPVTKVGIGADHPCSGCLGDQHGGMTAGCSAVGCWAAPVLPAQSTTPEPLAQVAFAVPPDVVIAGIATAPDPHPPRSSLPT